MPVIAVIVCPELVKTYLMNYSRAFRFSTSLMISDVVAINLAFDTLLSAETSEKAQYARGLTQHLRARLKELGFSFSCRQTEDTHVTGVFIERPREVAAWLYKQGFLVSAIVFPVVPLGTDRLRICTHAHNNVNEVERLASLSGDWVAKQTDLPNITPKL